MAVDVQSLAVPDNLAAAYARNQADATAMHEQRAANQNALNLAHAQANLAVLHGAATQANGVPNALAVAHQAALAHLQKQTPADVQSGGVDRQTTPQLVGGYTPSDQQQPEFSQQPQGGPVFPTRPFPTPPYGYGQPPGVSPSGPVGPPPGFVPGGPVGPPLYRPPVERLARRQAGFR